MKQKLLNDISNIYSIRASIMTKLSELAELCICDYLVEAKLSEDDLVEVNIGIGKICFIMLEDSIEYRFVPSTKLEKLIIKSIASMKSPIINASEQGLENKLVSTYKELF